MTKPHDNASRRVRTPGILQFESTECGAVALAIVLAHYGCHVSLSELRRQCGVSRDGSKAINMLQAARTYGLQAQGVRVGSVDALRQLKLPMIVFWQFDHFLVVEGIGASEVHVNDPAVGPRTIASADFDLGFTGVALTFEPEAYFVPLGAKPSVLRPLVDRLASSWSAVGFIALATLALVLPGLALAGLSKVFIDNVLIGGLQDWLWPLIAGMAGAAFLAACISWVQEICLLRLRVKFTLVTAAGFLWHTIHLPLGFFQQRYAGDIGERLDGNERIAEFLSDDIAEGAVGLLTLVLYGWAMFVLDTTLALVAVCAGLLNIILFAALARPIGRRAQRYLQDSARLAGIEIGGLQTIETLRATGTEDEFLERRAAAHASEINAHRRMENYSRALELAPDFLTGAATIVVLGLGAQKIIGGELTVGTLVAFETLVLSFHQPLAMLLDSAEEVQMRRADLLRLDDTLRQDWDGFYAPNDHAEADTPTRIAVYAMEFGYSPFDEPVLHNVDIAIEEGQRIALVGRTGSGKTTLARILCGLFEPRTGSVERPDIQSAGASERSVAVVDQDCQLFEGTVRENLTMWDDSVADRLLWRCLEDACVNDVVKARGGLDAWVAESGANFSGGERQRIEIARALVGNPKILLLDEATGALDAPVEKRVLDNIWARNCGALIIAHRLSAVRDCDEIVVLEGGAIAMRGTHEELVARSSDYRTLLAWETDPDA